MGCNAWNHAYDCNCGWGGSTGGGGRRGVATASAPREVRWTDGRDWQPERCPRYESYVNPNARCPECGANVFFYQSPHGGRVFFDELGPPWPKHPCTDTHVRRTSMDLVLAVEDTPITSKPKVLNPHVWQPLIPKQVRIGATIERVDVDTSDLKISGNYLLLPRGFVSDGPAFWRRTPNKAGRVDVSTVQINLHGTMRERLVTVPSWYVSGEQRRTYLETRELDGQTLNAIGWSLSFAWQDASSESWLQHPGVDLALARRYFKAAARKGFWAGWNNPGVMFRDGLGQAPDLEKAFRCFRAAARSREPTPLVHLAACYKDGSGVPQNEARANQLLKMALRHLAAALKSPVDNLPKQLLALHGV
jgi:hypothetical protein